MHHLLLEKIIVNWTICKNKTHDFDLLTVMVIVVTMAMKDYDDENGNSLNSS